jgi:hypothetical protein
MTQWSSIAQTSKSGDDMPGIKTSEFKLMIVALALTAAEVLGVDIQVLMAQWQNPGLSDLIDMMREAHKGGGWQAVLAMWGGVALYTWLRTKIKTQG